ncbi:raffinose/stachyose/melibiose transport system substrate-binding protein [Asanoa ishikariensis]|uniref:Raffinose/stachyose/melibiose transport system substrate-binding protein n=1 Tax=Asanoa ishikariensis TaxID=137265 RepID=A0A1H3NB74_9ACTN|nr:extracellular solute-binding protein [Asanoa ishikariensis]SDY86003.1 raffinose/stachyose/melibiose transport system substrate-binding protein [Asanoa ishikariensis]
MARRINRAVACLVTVALLGGCGVFGDDDGRTSLDFFQFKPEAIQTFDKLIADFERLHPDIHVVQNHVPDADTAIRTRLVRDDIPDVLTLNANASFGELARAGVFYDFSGEAVTGTVTPAILDIINALGTGGPGEVNGLPFANNANGVIYNKDLFARYDVRVPTTWPELITAAETFKAAGVTPFYATLKDSWTALPSFNVLAANLPPDDFWERLRAGDTSFAAGYGTVAERFQQLFSYAQQDKLSRGYNDGNQAFAEGKTAMYLQGSWAIPTIRTFKPAFDIGVFPMPMDSAGDTRLVSGVDVAITLGRDPAKKDAAMTFVNYLMQPSVVEAYAAEQSAVPTLKGLEPADDALKDLVPVFAAGQVTGFADHQVPPAIPLPQICQQFLIDGNRAAFLASLDDEWDKFARRRN